MGYDTMCHEYHVRGSTWEREVEEEAAEDDDLPSYLNESGSDDAEILTDGGDES